MVCLAADGSFSVNKRNSRNKDREQAMIDVFDLWDKDCLPDFVGITVPSLEGLCLPTNEL